MITIDGQCKRNLPEQVGKNKEDIENLQGKVTKLEEKVDTKSVVSGVASGENWSTITINGETKSIPSEPANYIVDITNSGNTYTAQKHNGSTIQWTIGSGPSQYIKAIDINNNQLTWYDKDDNPTQWEPDFSDQFAGKQDTLVSGTNIKTINSQSLLGAGNITISGEPSAYLKSASVSDNTLTLTNKDDSVVLYTPTIDLSAYRTSTAQDVIDATKLDATKSTIQTIAPTAAITDGGIHIVILSSEPATKYNGYIYLINEA